MFSSQWPAHSRNQIWVWAVGISVISTDCFHTGERALTLEKEMLTCRAERQKRCGHGARKRVGHVLIKLFASPGFIIKMPRISFVSMTTTYWKHHHWIIGDTSTKQRPGIVPIASFHSTAHMALSGNVCLTFSWHYIKTLPSKKIYMDLRWKKALGAEFLFGLPNRSACTLSLLIFCRPQHTKHTPTCTKKTKYSQQFPIIFIIE